MATCRIIPVWRLPSEIELLYRLLSACYSQHWQRDCAVFCFVFRENKSLARRLHVVLRRCDHGHESNFINQANQTTQFAEFFMIHDNASQSQCLPVAATFGSLPHFADVLRPWPLLLTADV